VAVTPNIGTVDAYVRLAAGLFCLGLGIKDRRPIRSLLLIAFGANKVAEGVTRFCPLLYLMGENTVGSAYDDVLGDRRDSGYGQWTENPYPTHSSSDLLELEGDAPDGGDSSEDPARGGEKRRRPLRLVSWRRRSPS